MATDPRWAPALQRASTSTLPDASWMAARTPWRRHAFLSNRLRAKSTPAQTAEPLDHRGVAALLLNAKAKPEVAAGSPSSPLRDAASEEAQ